MHPKISGTVHLQSFLINHDFRSETFVISSCSVWGLKITIITSSLIAYFITIPNIVRLIKIQLDFPWKDQDQVTILHLILLYSLSQNGFLVVYRTVRWITGCPGAWRSVYGSLRSYSLVCPNLSGPSMATHTYTHTPAMPLSYCEAKAPENGLKWIWNILL